MELIKKDFHQKFNLGTKLEVMLLHGNNAVVLYRIVNKVYTKLKRVKNGIHTRFDLAL
jgi:hypothetical protein